MDSFYSKKELQTIGFKSIGDNVKLSRNASVYSPQFISIGDNVRIDDFCILSGNITIGSHVHISAYVALYGSKGIVLEDYCGISAKSIVYSAMDDFSGDYLIGPIHHREKTNVTGGLVRIRKYSQVGAGVIVFPNLEIGEGTVIGALSLVLHSVGDWGVYCGIPCKRLKDRNQGLLKYV